jgi:ketosteroid isomerase-like protein
VLDINETSDVVVRVREDTAVLTGVLHQRGTFDGWPFDVRLRVTDTWVRTRGQWRILAGHASVLEPAAKPAS